MLNMEECQTLRDQLDKVIEEILNIDEDMEKESKAIYPIYRLMNLKRGIKKSIERVDEDEEAVRRKIRNIS